MTNAKIDKWAQLLLDLGKGNNLINFKDRQSCTASIVAPDADIVFSKLSGGSLLEMFDPKLDDEYDDENNKAERLEREEYIAKYSGGLKRNKVLPYSSSGSPIAAIRQICKRARSAIEETGVNIAYAAFGFVHWTEKEGAKDVYRAPLLLIPVNIKNDSRLSPCYISEADDDVIVNPTFDYKLDLEHNLHLPEYGGQQLSEYLAEVSTLVKRLGWKVTDEVKLGTFSFLKINMYRDLKDNAQKITESKVVRAIMGEPFDAGEEGESRSFEETDFHNIVDADSSQLEAIALAKSGRSFVLQGPPGTGKSQTITNIIAELLADGKRVLFVSEKLAALEVVYDKLKKAGLDEFCLQLHSYKANKKEVIEELERTLKLAKSVVSSKAESELAALQKTRAALDGYERELHSVRPGIDCSLYELFEKHAALRKYRDLDYIVTDIKNKGADNLNKACDLLEKYEASVPSIGYDYKTNPWYGYIVPDASYAAERDAKHRLGDMADLTDELSALARELTEAYGLDCGSIHMLGRSAELLRVVGESDFISPALLDKNSAAAALALATELRELTQTVRSGREQLSAEFDDDIYKPDGAAVHKQLAKQFKSIFKRLFSKQYRALAASIRLCARDGVKTGYRKLCAAMQTLAAVQAAEAGIAERAQRAEEAFAGAYKGTDTDWTAVIAQLKALSTCLDGCSPGKLAAMSAEELSSRRGELLDKYHAVHSVLEDNAELISGVAADFDGSVFDPTKAALCDVSDKLGGCIREFDTRNNWIVFNKLLADITDHGMRDYVDTAIAQNVPAEQLLPVYQKLFYRQWIDCVITGSPALLRFNRTEQDKAVSVFAQKDRLQFEINKARIKQTLSALRPDLNFVAGGSSVSVLLREAQKKRKQKPIRQLLGEIGDLVQLLKPCFMMSPLSVSTFLDSDKISFDAVVFDEASQIFPQDAIGAIYRGKQAIVVGDSKQMPPSNFFNAMTGSDEYDDEDEDIKDFDSVLDLCLTAMPARRLKWHYRSRFEELISFSNRNFYDGELISFPSAQQKSAGVGVDYHHVDGVFDRKTKTNRAEAEYIAKLVFSNFKSFPRRSLGVVAFSAAQQELIERCLSKLRQADGSMEEFFKPDREEPFFIKNLETVQGDERDTIIFSMAYARDAQGRFIPNFGPVNRVGGERRLNVAVTRAKYNVQFVASVHSYDIDLKNSQSKSVGARLLREYLDFAENGMIALERSLHVNQFESYDSDFELEVHDFLTEKGYCVDTQVGCSRFRIDLALKKPNSSQYVLAIECDGASYHSSASARDRDRLRQQILEGMGWRFYRIWSTDWFKNNRVEGERLLAAAEQALSAAPPAPIKASGEARDFVEEKPQVKLRFPYYKTVNADTAWRKSGRSYPAMVVEILKTEAPLSEEWLLKRTVHLFGRTKVNSVVLDEYEREMSGCRRYGIVRRDGFLYTEGGGYMLRIPAPGAEQKREIKHISLEELASGMREIIAHNVSLGRDGLFKETATQLGFSRMGEAISARLGEALQLLCDELTINGDIIKLK